VVSAKSKILMFSAIRSARMRTVAHGLGQRLQVIRDVVTGEMPARTGEQHRPAHGSSFQRTILLARVSEPCAQVIMKP
jgi:hypothetical protein